MLVRLSAWGLSAIAISVTVHCELRRSLSRTTFRVYGPLSPGSWPRVEMMDPSEDIPGGLEAVLNMDFTASARCVILVADAPCHGSEFHDVTTGMTDSPNHLAHARAGPDIRAQVRMLARRGIDFTVIEIMPRNTARMVAILQQEHQRVLAYDGRGRAFAKVALPQAGDVARLGATIASSASSSLSASKMRSVLVSAENEVGGSGADKKFSLAGIKEEVVEGEDEEKEDEQEVEMAPMEPLHWAALDGTLVIPALRHSYHFRHGDEIDWANLKLEYTIQETMIELRNACFARGAMRSAHAMFDHKMGKRFVAKVYYGRAAAEIARGGWRPDNDVMAQAVAKRLAIEFSTFPQARDGVDFICTSWYEIENPQDFGLSKAMASLTAEPYIAGEYKKYNNNNGWIYDGGVAELRDTAQAFSHFTWQRTLGQLLVVDLQGVGCIFTDPQIHSLDKQRFGRGNLSEVGMAAFFATHECNDVCEELGLLPCTADGFASCPDVAMRADDDRALTDKLMTCSCSLCGEILQLARSTFVAAFKQGRDVQCMDCSIKVHVKEPRQCIACEQVFQVPVFWFNMKGMMPPVSCDVCKAVAAGEMEVWSAGESASSSPAGRKR